MTIAIVILLVAAAAATVWREFIWMDRLKETGWKHNDRVKSLEVENEQLEASARQALTALKEASLEMTFARLQIEQLVSVTDAKQLQ